MACPKCGCKVHYQYDTGHDPAERCASCGKVFYPEEAADDADDEEEVPAGVRTVEARSLTDEQISAAWEADKTAMQHDPRTPREAFWAGALWASSSVPDAQNVSPQGSNSKQGNSQ